MVVVLQQMVVGHELVEDRKMKRNDIKALDQCLDLVGKRIKSSKSKISWSFDVHAVCFTIELLISSYSGKKRVKMNGQVVKEAKDTSALTFTHGGVIFDVINSKYRGKYGYDLLINGHAFSELHKGRIAQKLLPKANPTLEGRGESKNIIHIHVESSPTSVESACPGQQTEEPLSCPRPQVQQQSSRKLLRRSDASVRDIAAVRGRPFRRSEASVKDVLSLADPSRCSKADDSTNRSSYTASALAARAAQP